MQINVNYLKAAALVTSKEETRYYLKGVSISASDKGVFIVATDGHRLAAFRQAETYDGSPMDIIIPIETVNALKTKEETVEEGWDDMVKSAKDAVKSGPKPSGGSGVKQGSRYGGGKQKDKPEHEEDKKEDKKKVTEAKHPEDNSVPFEAPYNTSSSPAVKIDKSGAKHTPMSRAKHLEIGRAHV